MGPTGLGMLRLSSLRGVQGACRVTPTVFRSVPRTQATVSTLCSPPVPRATTELRAMTTKPHTALEEMSVKGEFKRTDSGYRKFIEEGTEYAPEGKEGCFDPFSSVTFGFSRALHSTSLPDDRRPLCYWQPVATIFTFHTRVRGQTVVSRRFI